MSQFIEKPKLPISKYIPFNTKYLSSDLIKSFIKTSTFPNQAIEEENSELWANTYTGYGKFITKEGNTITGHIQNGILSSENETKSCSIIFSNGTKYEGDIKDNQLIGKGTYNFPSGAQYSGDICFGLRHGHGLYTSADGIMYEGQWDMGKKEGSGKLIKGDMAYEGEFKEGLIDGIGKLYWNNGDIYEGEFKNNLINGNGAMVWIETHEKYTGQWVNNLQNGYGIHTWFESSTNSRGFRNRYVGEWKEGTKHGYGVFFYSDGSKYEGYWENDEKHGFGVFTFKNGTQYIGKFVHDRMFDFNSEGIVEISKGTILDTNTFERTTTSSQGNVNVKKGFGVKLPKINANKRVAKETKKTSGLEVIMESNNEATPMKVALNSGSLNEETKTNKHKQPSINNTQSSTKYNKKKHNEDDRELNSVYIASNRVIKSTDTNQFKTMIDITDIIDTQSNTEQTEKEVENALQRNMTEIRTWYFKLLKIELQEQDNFFMISRVQTNNNINLEDELNSNNDDDINPQIESIPLNSQNSPNIISPINPNSQNLLNDNKIGTYLELRDVWKLFRDFGIISPELTIAKLNRNFYKNPKNSVEMFLFPNVNDKPKQYSLVYEMISKSFENFKNKHDAYLQLEQKLLQTPKSNSHLTGIKLPKDDDNSKQMDCSVYYQEEDLEKIRIEFDFHQPRNVITLKQFYEIVVRAAYIKFFYLDIPLDKKIELLVSKCKMKPKEKKSEQTSKDKEQTDNQSSFSKAFGKNILMQGLMNDISNRMLGGNFNNNTLNQQQNQLTLEQKQRNAEHALIDTFINKHEETLFPIFHKLCYYQREQNCLNEDCNDHTITHRFLFYNLIKHSSLLCHIYGTKEQYVDLITYYFKEKQKIFDNKKEEFDYYEMLLDLELVFFEFCEMVYIMTQRCVNEATSAKNKAKKEENEEEVNYKDQVNHADVIEIMKLNEEEQNVFMIKHIQSIIQTSHNFSQRKDVKYAKQRYMFPERTIHKQLDKEMNDKIEKEHSRLLKRYEKIRFTNERKMFMEEEKINAFIPPEGMDNEPGEYEEEEVADY